MEQRDNHVSAQQRSMAAGNDINIGDNNRIAAGDYHEHHAPFYEKEPEWGKPPFGSGLVRCPGCKRAHFHEDALDCPRCSYPHREKQQARWRHVMVEAERERALNTLAGVVCMMLTIYVMLSHDVLSIPTPIIAVLAFGVGYYLVVDALRWLDGKLKDYLQR